MEEIDLKELLLILKKKLWIIILITILCGATTGFVSYYLLEPEYQAYTTLMVGRPQEYKQDIEYDDVLLNQKLVSTYGEIAKSRVVAKALISNLNLNISYQELEKKIEVAMVKDTEIIKILVKDKNGEMAARIANEIANVFMKQVAMIMKIENIQVIDMAEIPSKPENPKPLINIMLAGILGIMLSLVIVFLQEYLDNTVKGQEDIEKYMKLPVLGVIPKVS